MMTIISSLLLFALGVSPSSGKVTYGNASHIVEEHDYSNTH
jgi:hypothetical protein